ncbi:MAG: ThuA domain-containing protein [Candidatus Hydrogenedentes bacterium]|nr:ThuA domain-containing protein [Candidatus Hydrogenedentota bacterium]
MFTSHTLSRGFAIGLLALFAVSQASSQSGQQLNLPWQEPQERDPADVARIMGPIEQSEPSRDLNILWVWGIDQFHDQWRDAHEYAWVMDRYVYDLLRNVPRVTATAVYYWPTKEQWDKADLVVFYLMPHSDGATGFDDGTEPEGDPRSIWDYDTIDAYQKRGGGLIFIHFAVYEGDGVELAKRIGLAWGTKRDAAHGIEPTASGSVVTMTVTPAGSDSPILRGFPKTFDLHDELYWPLTGDQTSITTLVTAEATTGNRYRQDHAPDPEEMDGKAWPVAWTKEVGKGRVFGTIAGHNFFAFNDPYFRIILLRAMAWTMNESFDPFKPLVTMHLER